MARLGEAIMLLDGLDLAAAEVVAAKGEQAIGVAAGGTHSGGSSWAPGIPTIYGAGGGLAADYDLISQMDQIPEIVNPAADFDAYMNDIPIELPTKTRLISASNGANYAGGTSWVPGLPLTPSSAGLAGVKRSGKKAKAGKGQNMRRSRIGIQGKRTIDPSMGVNYMGGASYSPGMPLLPSNSGLAAEMQRLDALAAIDMKVKQVSKGFQTRKYVIDPSAGANRSGGSTYFPGSPLLPSSNGLAACGACGLAGAKRGRRVSPNLPVSGPAPINMKVRQAMRGVQLRSSVIDPSAGANYNGGATYAAGLPLLPSAAGLADADLIRYNARAIARDVQSRTMVIDPSSGANRSGGSTYYPGSPLLPSSVGLAALEGKVGRKIKKAAKVVGKATYKVGKVVAPIVGAAYGIPPSTTSSIFSTAEKAGKALVSRTKSTAKNLYAEAQRQQAEERARQAEEQRAEAARRAAEKRRAEAAAQQRAAAQRQRYSNIFAGRSPAAAPKTYDYSMDQSTADYEPSAVYGQPLIYDDFSSEE